MSVRHPRGLDGRESELGFFDDPIVCTTENKKDAREWLVERDIDSVLSPNRYQVELHVYEDNRREFSHTRVFKFDLKEKLNSEVYSSLKLRLFALR